MQSDVPWMILLPVALGIAIYLVYRQQHKNYAVQLQLPLGGLTEEEKRKTVISKMDEAIDALHECQVHFANARGNIRDLKAWTGG